MNKIIDLLDYYGKSYTMDALKTIIEKSKDAKTDLNKLLSGFEFDQENDRYYFTLTTVTEPKVSDALYYAYRMGCVLEHHSYYTSPLYQVLKVLTSKGISNIDEESYLIGKTLGLKLGKGMKLTKFVNKYMLDKYTAGNLVYTEDEKQIVQKYYNEMCDLLVSKEVSETVYLSTNIYDFYRMSHGNSWQSCHSPDGDYAGGITGYGLDKETFIVYVESDKEESCKTLTTRYVAHVVGDTLYQGRIYGDNSIVTAIRDKLASDFARLNGCNIIESGATSTTDDFYNSRYRGYNDLAYYQAFVTTHDKTFNESVRVGHHPLCSICGEHSNSCELNCDGCEGEKVYCECHNEYVPVEDTVYISRIEYSTRRSGYYCDTETFYCPHCDNQYHIDDAVYVHGVGDVCCYCADDHFPQCDLCGDRHSSDDLRTIHTGEYVCESCLSEYELCSVCDEYMPSEDVTLVVTPEGLERMCNCCRREK